ncbi:hypothetical protein GTP23_11115 [Pseudoduganella sp. FT93W]|uniref:Peptidase M56 domain-containing protein n=1 Tax=Duganella fentianensis TaxID=2692177 RepID=A0A845I0K7_9BURK|nr:hypothetical protein [Duganella fentianensis]
MTVLLVFVALHYLAKASAAQRVFAARCGMVALLLTPLLWTQLPTPALRLPHAWTALLDPPLELPRLEWLAVVPNQDTAQAMVDRAADLGRYLIAVYIAGVSLFLAPLFLGLLRLSILSRKSIPVESEKWRTELARLRGQFGITRDIALHLSDKINAPISWGLVRPIVLLDRRSLLGTQPETILAHELGHIAHHDWPGMIGAKLLVALYWWHPLMHLLLKKLAYETECAADDATLAAGVTPSTYAETLVSVSQRAFGASKAANSLAGSGKPFVDRIVALLETDRDRERVSTGQWILGSCLTALIITVLGSLVVRGEHVVWPDTMFAAPRAGDKQAEQLLEELGNPNFSQLAKAMRARDFAQRHAEGGVSFRQRAAIPALLLAMRDADPVVRRLAVWGLSELRFPETIPAVAAALVDHDAAVRGEAVAALGDFAESRWRLPMLAMLKDESSSVRARAAHALGDLGEKSSISALENTLSDTHPQVVAEAEWALRELR